MFRINQKGGTMVEAIAVISIMTVLGISAIKLIGGLFDGFKQNIVTSEIRELQKKRFRPLFGGRPLRQSGHCGHAGQRKSRA